LSKCNINNSFPLFNPTLWFIDDPDVYHDIDFANKLLLEYNNPVVFDIKFLGWCFIGKDYTAFAILEFDMILLIKIRYILKCR